MTRLAGVGDEVPPRVFEHEGKLHGWIWPREKLSDALRECRLANREWNAVVLHFSAKLNERGMFDSAAADAAVREFFAKEAKCESS